MPELARGHVRTPFGDRAHHVEQPQSAADLRALQRHLEALLLGTEVVEEHAEGLHARDLADEVVRIGKEHRPLGSVHLEHAGSFERGVEAEQPCACSPPSNEAIS